MTSQEKGMRALSNALGLTLFCKESGSIRSREKIVRIDIPAMGHQLTARPEVMTSFISMNGKEVGVGVKIMGKLGLLAGSLDKREELRILVLDLECLGTSTFVFRSWLLKNRVNSWKQAVASVEKAVVSQFVKSFEDSEWTETSRLEVP